MVVQTSRLKKLAEELKSRTEMEKSMRVARKRQLKMLPSIPAIPGYDLHFLYLPATKVSGDFYDFIELEQGLIGIALGDVAGHGIEAGIIMGMAKKALQIYARGKTSPKEALIITNEDLARDFDGETFLSASYGILDPQKFIFRYARAGHNPPFLINPERQPQVTEIKPGGMVIGVDKSGRRFEQVTQEEVIRMQKGDMLFQYTDGLVEAGDKNKEEFGTERLKDLLLKNWALSSGDLLGLIEDTLQSHLGVQEQEDDVTMIALKVL